MTLTCVCARYGVYIVISVLGDVLFLLQLRLFRFYILKWMYTSVTVFKFSWRLLTLLSNTQFIAAPSISSNFFVRLFFGLGRFGDQDTSTADGPLLMVVTCSQAKLS